MLFLHLFDITGLSEMGEVLKLWTKTTVMVKMVLLKF
jgi:hypothetical protein